MRYGAEKTYKNMVKKEIAKLQKKLKNAQTDDEKRRIQGEIETYRYSINPKKQIELYGGI